MHDNTGLHIFDGFLKKTQQYSNDGLIYLDRKEGKACMGLQSKIRLSKIEKIVGKTNCGSKNGGNDDMKIFCVQLWI